MATSDLKDIRAVFGSAVRCFRKELGLSQEKLAERCGLHRTYLADVERGTRNVGLENVARIAEALQIPIPRLFEECARGTNLDVEAGEQVFD
jgi:transcriptional regulator with XRE-family HTH domain